jgi:Fe-S cluster assembly protein SufB
MRLQRVKLVKIKFSIAINPTEKAIALIVNGFSKDVLNKLPMEFAVEAQKLLEISLEGSVG